MYLDSTHTHIHTYIHALTHTHRAVNDRNASFERYLICVCLLPFFQAHYVAWFTYFADGGALARRRTLIIKINSTLLRSERNYVNWICLPPKYRLPSLLVSVNFSIYCMEFYNTYCILNNGILEPGSFIHDRSLFYPVSPSERLYYIPKTYCSFCIFLWCFSSV
jgi:hypothetical protein